jgi:flavin reductase (DIM6/NTAB) family NADH-FMN oxidoreductase RutF
MGSYEELAEGAVQVTADEHRRVLGHFVSGVTIITAMCEGEPVGMAANSFTSVSLDPALVAFCAAKSSSTWPRIRSAGRFCVNILSEEQEEICRLFATKGADRFAFVDWTPAVSRSPILDGVLGWIDCTIENEIEAGDHTIVIGRVIRLDVPRDGLPLVFFRGGYGKYQI